MHPLIAIASGIGYGALHGLGPDHCAALGALLVRDERGGAALRISVRFGLGHAITLGSLALVAVVSGWLIPKPWEQGAEVLGGLLLVVLGLLALGKPRLDVFAHRHLHDHQESAHEHWHLHRVGGADHNHVHLATVVGGAMALSAVRGLALAVPPLMLAGTSWPVALMFVAAFGLGVAGSMATLGLVYRAVLKRFGCRERIGSWGRRAVGALSILVGVAWIWANAV